MNKRGLYVASLSVIILAAFVIGYNIDRLVKEKNVALDKIGVSAVSTINSFYEGERIKYGIHEITKYSVLKALILMGKNGGIYDKSGCTEREEYLIWRGNCQPTILNEDFEKYFNDSFNEYLNEIDLELDDFIFNIGGNLNIKGEIKEKFKINIKGISESKIDILEVNEENLANTLENLKKYIDIIKEKSEKYDVPENLVLAIITRESGGDRYAVSPVGAAGLMQLMPETAAKDLGLKNTIYDCDMAGDYSTCDCIASKKDTCDFVNDERFDPERNLDGGIIYLKKLLDEYKDIELALAAYNWGPNRVEGNCILEKGFDSCRNVPDETKNYVEKVTAWYELLGGEEISVERIGTYSIKPKFDINIKYSFEDYNEIKRVAENCLEDSEKCIGTSNYNLIKNEQIGNIRVFEFESKENIGGIKPVIIKFGLPV